MPQFFTVFSSSICLYKKCSYSVFQLVISKILPYLIREVRSRFVAINVPNRQYLQFEVHYKWFNIAFPKLCNLWARITDGFQKEMEYACSSYWRTAAYNAQMYICFFLILIHFLNTQNNIVGQTMCSNDNQPCKQCINNV